MGTVKTIALVAHDNKKAELIQWALKHKEELKKHQLIATGTTGKMLADALQHTVQIMLSGPLGGDQQIGSMIAQKEIDILIFFWDPMQAQPHDSDVKALLRLGVTWNLPMACDVATADYIITSPLLQNNYEREVPEFGNYLNRKIEK